MQTDETLPPSQINEMAYDDLLVAVEASENSLSLFLVVCDNFRLREEIIQRYETELDPEIRNYRITLPKQDPSLRQAIARTIEADPYLKSGGRAVLTVLGAEQLLPNRYGADRSEQEIFLGYLQWTREGLREFRYPIVLWLTEPLLEEVSRKARDFWSWRKDVFRFVSETPTLLDRLEVAQIPQNLPYLGNVTFVGRERELEVLHEQFGTTTICAIAGMGGIGKTELALQYAAKYSSNYPGGICWLRAREDVGTQIVAFARRFLGLEPPSELSITEQVAWSWRHWIPGDVLAIFDDVQSYSDIRALLPPPDPRFKVLLTTRSRIGSSVGELLIGTLSLEVALELLRSLIPDGRIDQELDAATQLCEWLGYLPLGVELVGRYLFKKPDLSIEMLWQRLQEKRLEARAFKQAEPGMTASLGVAAAFELSWQELNSDAQKLAAFLSLFALAEIPWTLVQACLPEMDEEDLENLRNAQLVNLSLLTSTKAGMYELHPLLREFFAVKRSQMANDEEMKRSFCRGMSEIDLHISLPLTITTIEQMAPLIPHLKEATTTLEPWLADADLIKPSTWIGQFYQEQSAFEEAEKWFLHSRSIATHRLGTNHPAVAQSLNNLAELYRLQGRYGEAEPLYLQALDIRQRQLGADHPAMATSLNNLALLYKSQERDGEAELAYLWALQISRQALGDNHPDVAIGLNNLAGLYVNLKRYAEAEPLFLQAITISNQRLGEAHPNTQTFLRNFREFLQQVIQSDRTAELSDDPMTRSLLQQLQNASD